MKLQSPYHLPHNSIRIDEFDFMLKAIDCSREFYTYDELRLLFLKEEIEKGLFSSFHPKPHNKLSNHRNEKYRKLYNDAKSNSGNCRLLLAADFKYTNAKTFKQVWNEFVRDYTEFFAFIGLLPSYYKGGRGGLKHHYVSSLVKEYQDKRISLEELLFMYKYRNSSKDEKSIDMYEIEVRPFVIALKALQYYFSKGELLINPHILSTIVKYSHNEYDDYSRVIDLFPKPNLELSEYSSAFEKFNSSIEKEIGRATLFLKPYLLKMGFVVKERCGNKDYFRITEKVRNYHYPNKCVFCDGGVGKYKLTPLIGKVLRNCELSAGKYVPQTQLFDDNFSKCDIKAILEELQHLQVIENYDEGGVHISEVSKQFQVNPYADFRTIEEGDYVNGTKELVLKVSQRTAEIHGDLDLSELRKAALSSDGAAYEEQLHETLKQIKVFSETEWYGSAQTGKRLSDLACPIQISSKGNSKTILLIVECKASNAIRSFDERKEIVDIINTLKKYNNYDGVWYWVTDSNSLPDYDVHGGYRSSSESKSFIEKLNELQFDISEESHTPSIVTAFSIDALVTYLNYIYKKSEKLVEGDSITETIIPHFWRWSKKFMNVQYVTIHKQINL